jgi:hypothetical protein
MRKIIFIFVLFASALAYSQYDSLLFKNGDFSWVRILSTEGETIAYTVEGEPENQIYFTNKAEVRKIYSHAALRRKKARRCYMASTFKEFTHHFVGFNFGPLRSKTLSVVYSGISKNGRHGADVLFFYNLQPQKYFPRQSTRSAIPAGYSDNKLMASYRHYSFGLQYKFYPAGQKRFSFHYGPSVQAARFSYGLVDKECEDALWTYQSITSGPPAFCVEEQRNGVNLSVMINNGFLYRVNKHLYADFDLGMGFQKIYCSETEDDHRMRLQFAGVVGYSF